MNRKTCRALRYTSGPRISVVTPKPRLPSASLIANLSLTGLMVLAVFSGTSCKMSHGLPDPFDPLPQFTIHCWEPAWRPDGGAIAFRYVPWVKVAPDSWVVNWDSAGIYLIDADGENKRPLLLEAGSPHFSPDGKWLLFAGGPGGGNNLHKGKVDGDSVTSVTQLTFGDFRNYHPRWSPDGQKVLFGRYTRPTLDSAGLCLMDAEGSNIRVLHDVLDGRIVDGGDFLSNSQIVFSGWVEDSPGIWTTDTLGRNKLRIYGQLGILRCSPDGTRILVGNYNDKKVRHEIWRVNADGSSAKRLSIEGIDPAWSPDGTKIVYVKVDFFKLGGPNPGYGELWIMNADGANKRQLTFLD